MCGPWASAGGSVCVRERKEREGGREGGEGSSEGLRREAQWPLPLNTHGPHPYPG